jgi:hypothetical protein
MDYECCGLPITTSISAYFDYIENDMIKLRNQFSNITFYNLKYNFKTVFHGSNINVPKNINILFNEDKKIYTYIADKKIYVDIKNIKISDNNPIPKYKYTERITQLKKDIDYFTTSD